jgi:hypothetical protein
LKRISLRIPSNYEIEELMDWRKLSIKYHDWSETAYSRNYESSEDLFKNSQNKAILLGDVTANLVVLCLSV